MRRPRHRHRPPGPKRETCQTGIISRTERATHSSLPSRSQLARFYTNALFVDPAPSPSHRQHGARPASSPPEGKSRPSGALEPALFLLTLGGRRRTRASPAPLAVLASLVAARSSTRTRRTCTYKRPTRSRCRSRVRPVPAPAPILVPKAYLHFRTRPQ